MRIKKREKKGKIEPLNLKNVQNSWIFLKCFARDLAWKYLGNMELIRFLRFFFYKNIFQNQLVPRSQNSKIFWMYKTNVFIYSLRDDMNFLKTKFCSFRLKNETQKKFYFKLKIYNFLGSILCFV